MNLNNLNFKTLRIFQGVPDDVITTVVRRLQQYRTKYPQHSDDVLLMYLLCQNVFTFEGAEVQPRMLDPFLQPRPADHIEAYATTCPVCSLMAIVQEKPIAEADNIHVCCASCDSDYVPNWKPVTLPLRPERPAVHGS